MKHGPSPRETVLSVRRNRAPAPRRIYSPRCRPCALRLRPARLALTMTSSSAAGTTYINDRGEVIHRVTGDELRACDSAAGAGQVRSPVAARHNRVCTVSCSFTSAR